MRRMKKKIGFTLIELVVVMVLIGIIAGASLHPLSRFLELWLFNNNRVQVLWGSRSALRNVAYNVRMVRGRADVLATTATRFHFVNARGQDVDYQLSNGALYNGSINNPNNRLLLRASCPGNKCFTYLSCPAANNNVCTENSATFNALKIDIAATYSSETVTLESTVNCRNLN